MLGQAFGAVDAGEVPRWSLPILTFSAVGASPGVPLLHGLGSLCLWVWDLPFLW